MRHYDFNTFPRMEKIKEQVYNSYTLQVFRDTERNVGFEVYSGHIIDVQGSIIFTAVSAPSIFEISELLIKVSAILKNQNPDTVYIPMNMRGES